MWQRWTDATAGELADEGRPFLLFVADADGTVNMFLREIFKAMSANTRVRELLHDEFPAVFATPEQLPVDVTAFGIGSRCHLAIVSSILNPIFYFDVISGDPGALVNRIVEVLERLLKNYRA